MRSIAIFVSALLVGACSGVPSASLVPPTAASPVAAASPIAPSASPSLTPEAAWAEDLAFFDEAVRAHHPDPFAINPESAWVARLAALRTSLPTTEPDEQLVQLASLTGLLDTHSWLDAKEVHAYGVLFYPFADGWWTIRATDPSLVGTRLVSIGGTPIEEIEAALRPLVPADNESGELDGLEGLLSFFEYLHGLGFVDDMAHPRYELASPDGTTIEVDPTTTDLRTWEEGLGIVGDLMGEAPEAVARRTEPVWWRLDEATKTFLLSYNDYEGGDLQGALDAMIAALHDDSADRVVVDLRYLRGGNGSLAQPLITALSSDPKVNEPGRLIVLIGRENVSAGTVVAAQLDRLTQARFVGEMTPARADNFLCECFEIHLPNSGYVAGVPTYTFGTGDPREAIAPDVPMALSAEDFFAGRDPVLDAVMAGDLP
jgi:hypothetical protein